MWAASSVDCGGNCRRGSAAENMIFFLRVWISNCGVCAAACLLLLWSSSLSSRHHHQTQGLGTSLKILFSQRQIEAQPGSDGLQRPRFHFSRQEIVSLLNAFGRWGGLQASRHHFFYHLFTTTALYCSSRFAWRNLQKFVGSAFGFFPVPTFIFLVQKLSISYYWDRFYEGSWW